MTFRTMAAVAALMLATGAQALTVQTTNFLAGYTNYNGFEGLGSTQSYSGAPYTEQGITVEYVGSAAIWTDSQAAEGSFSWYENGGGTGFTKITFGSAINAVEFQAGSGFGGSGPFFLQYEVLNGGTSIASGTIPGVSGYTGFNYYGFSGASFDEIHLQVTTSSGAFDPNAFEAGAYDAINFGGVSAGVPEASTWVMLIAGFGMVGAAARRRTVSLAA